MWSLLIRHFRWLDPYHPIAVRESRRNHPELPRFIRKLTVPWTMLGYAAMLHGIFFILSLIGYSKINRAFPNMMLPFLTPFGTPVAAGILHSVLYWAFLIGICNYTTNFVASEIGGGMWPILRTTPYTTSEIFFLLAKIGVVARIWQRGLRMLILTRLLALALIPISIMTQQTSEVSPAIGSAVLCGILFLIQPLVDGFVVASLSTFVGLWITDLMWAKIAAYAATGLVYGAFSGIAGLWLIFKSPVGTAAGVLVPLNHWAPLVAALVPPASSVEILSRTVITFLFYFALPLLVGVLALTASARRARTLY